MKERHEEFEEIEILEEFVCQAIPFPVVEAEKENGRRKRDDKKKSKRKVNKKKHEKE